MSAPAIRVEGLAKLYRLGREEERARSLVGALGGLLASPWRNFRRLRSLTHFDGGAGEDVLWALRDVAFEVAPGEVLGIIGRNGAGKSTLLKILSRITLPSAGRVEVHGRLSSLLEVGTGFHPELSGRDNIYLNGAILGLTRHEIRARFDAIVAFAEIGRFLDTPVKRYSSGMYVRLAFAVAAHLEPEILVVDEVLAVGDAQFQQKCLGKMRDVSRRDGRTILFVSHNLPAVSQLCSRALWLDGGRVRRSGPARDIAAEYLSVAAAAGEKLWPDGCAAEGTDDFQLLALRVRNAAGQTAATVEDTEDFTVELRVRVRRDLPPAQIGFYLSTAEGTMVFESFDCDDPAAWARRTPGEYTFTATVPAQFLRPGHYLLSAYADVPNVRVLAWAEGALQLTVQGLDPESALGRVRRAGVVQPRLRWRCEKLA